MRARRTMLAKVEKIVELTVSLGFILMEMDPVVDPDVDELGLGLGGLSIVVH